MLSVDAEKGDGIPLAKEFSVDGYPTFVVTDLHGSVVDRWMGYDNAEGFVASLDAAKADPLNVESRRGRWNTEPSARDALVLGRIASATGREDEAVEWFAHARELDADNAGDHVFRSFIAHVRGFRHGKFSLDQVKAAADEVIRVPPRETGSITDMALTMKKVLRAPSDREAWLPYLKAAMASPPPDRHSDYDVEARRDLEIEYALLVDKDRDRALGLRRAALPEGWQDNATQLNEFAWWCFENAINLEEAELLAVQGVEKADTPKERAMILDTVAEIRHLRGDREGAVKAIEEAVAADPKSDYYPKQLAKFSGQAL